MTIGYFPLFYLIQNAMHFCVHDAGAGGASKWIKLHAGVIMMMPDWLLICPRRHRRRRLSSTVVRAGRPNVDVEFTAKCGGARTGGQSQNQIRNRSILTPPARPPYRTKCREITVTRASADQTNFCATLRRDLVQIAICFCAAK